MNSLKTDARSTPSTLKTATSKSGLEFGTGNPPRRTRPCLGPNRRWRHDSCALRTGRYMTTQAYDVTRPREAGLRRPSSTVESFPYDTTSWRRPHALLVACWVNGRWSSFGARLSTGEGGRPSEIAPIAPPPSRSRTSRWDTAVGPLSAHSSSLHPSMAMGLDRRSRPCLLERLAMFRSLAATTAVVAVPLARADRCVAASPKTHSTQVTGG